MQEPKGFSLELVRSVQHDFHHLGAEPITVIGVKRPGFEMGTVAVALCLLPEYRIPVIRGQEVVRKDCRGLNLLFAQAVADRSPEHKNFGHIVVARNYNSVDCPVQNMDFGYILNLESQRNYLL